MRFVTAILMFLTGSLAWAHGPHPHPEKAHLTFAKGAYHVHATWEAGPQVSGESRLRLEWKNGVDHAATEAPGAFEVVLWMPSMGHGSAPTQINPAVDSQGQVALGVYDITQIYFIMGGDWDVNIKVTYPDGSQETQKILVRLPGDDHGGHHGH